MGRRDFKKLLKECENIKLNKIFQIVGTSEKIDSRWFIHGYEELNQIELELVYNSNSKKVTVGRYWDSQKRKANRLRFKAHVMSRKISDAIGKNNTYPGIVDLNEIYPPPFSDGFYIGFMEDE